MRVDIDRDTDSVSRVCNWINQIGDQLGGDQYGHFWDNLCYCCVTNQVHGFCTLLNRLKWSLHRFQNTFFHVLTYCVGYGTISLVLRLRKTSFAEFETMAQSGAIEEG